MNGRGALWALALVLASQVALAQKATRPRVVVLDFDGDRRGALHNQVESGLKKNKQLQLVPLKKYTSAATKAGLKGAAARAPEGIAQVAPGLDIDAVVIATVDRSLNLQVLGADGRELWTKSVKLQKGKMSASDVRRLVAGIATTAAKPPPRLPAKPPPEETAKPATPEPAPAPAPVTPPTATPVQPPPPVETAPKVEAPPKPTAPAAEPPLSAPEQTTAPATPKPAPEALESPQSMDDESHTTTKTFDEYASRAEIEAMDRHRYPPILFLFVGGTTTWRQYCARPGVASCAEFDSRPPENQVGDTIDFKSTVPYLGLAGYLEVLPLARTEKPWRGLGLVVGYQRGYSETRVKVTTDTGETPTRSVVATDSVITGMLMYRYYFNMGTESRPRLAYVGLRGGMLSRAFEVDQQARAPLTGSHRLFPAVGLEFSVPLLKHWLRIEGGGQYFLDPKVGKSLTGDKGELELEVSELGTGVSSKGWYGELGLAGELWGPLGYSVRGRYTTVKDTFTGAGSREGWQQGGGVASEQHIDIRWGLTASF